ncbi:MAG: hypothetical protein KJ072_11590, partial [Verrucomicrobia bacterium]|nr:hypothetical protein [Verrucomicrobiota bacterium]
MLIETAGGQPANAVARWDGSRWHSLGEGVGNLFRRATVWGIAASDIFVYVGGSFTNAGGVTVNKIACWNGRQWFPLGSGVEGNVLALAVRDRELYVAGVFESVGGRPSAHFGIWHEPLALWIAPVADDRVVISWSSAS